MSTLTRFMESLLKAVGTSTINFGGLVTAQTPETTDNSTNVATTAYVQNNLEAQSGILAGTGGITSITSFSDLSAGDYGPCYWTKSNGILTQRFAYICTGSGTTGLEDTITFPIPFSGIPYVNSNVGNNGNTVYSGATIDYSHLTNTSFRHTQVIYYDGSWGAVGARGHLFFVTAIGPA